MTFTRTASGVANISKFYRVDCLVYTEGASDEQTGGIRRPDEFYYKAVFRVIAPDLTVKVKCIGNQEAAFSYFKIIEKENIKNALVAVDRDTFGIDKSAVMHPKLIFTYGYSWESDLWTITSADLLIKALTAGAGSADDQFLASFEHGAKRLKFLSALDIAGRASGAKALLPKNKNKCGINIRASAMVPISSTEIRRLSTQYRNTNAWSCSISRKILATGLRASADKVIQGHLWENFVYQLVSTSIQRFSGVGKPEKALLRLILLTLFGDRTSECLGAERLEYYRSSIEAGLSCLDA